ILQAGAFDLSANRIDDRRALVGKGRAACRDGARCHDDGQLFIVLDGGEIANEGVEHATHVHRLALSEQRDIRIEAGSAARRRTLLRYSGRRKFGKGADVLARIDDPRHLAVVEQPIEDTSRPRGTKSITRRVPKTIRKMELAVGAERLAGKFRVAARS